MPRWHASIFRLELAGCAHMDPRTLHFKVFGTKEGELRTRLAIDAGEAVEERFDFDLQPAGRTSEVLHLIDAGACALDDLRDVGSQLWAALVPGEIGRRVAALREDKPGQRTRLCFRLDLPPSLTRLPWEALYDLDTGFISTLPGHAIVRHPPGGAAAASPARPLDKLRVLVVIPEGSYLKVDLEWKNIELAFQSIGGAAPTRLDGRVPPGRLLEELGRVEYDAVHFIGHGQVDDGVVTVRFNDENNPAEETWLEAEAFASMFRGTQVRFAFLNCCLGAEASDKRSLSGLGPYLLRAGVPAVVAMRFEIADDVAIRFSRAFYKDLLTGAERGRIDLAVESARKAVYLNKKKDNVRGFVTPVLFLATGGEQVFDAGAEPGRGAAEATALPAPGRARTPALVLPDELRDAMREGRCVPVIGPGIFAARANRSAAAGAAEGSLGVGTLAAKLAVQSAYPEMGDLDLASRTGDWLETLVLQRVCQHYEDTRQRYRLTLAVLEAHRLNVPPPELCSIASWDVPGVIYTHFDGLMELAYQHIGRAVRVVKAVDQHASTTGNVGAPLLVHLRGAVTDRSSLVLTEHDHDVLWSSFGKIAPEVTALVNEPGRSLVFLGLSPRDLFIKRFLGQLLTPTVLKDLGPIFFARGAPSPVDDACWRWLQVRWISADLESIIEELTAAASGSPR
jgi:CHAT domain/SIR2-like domain